MSGTNAAFYAGSINAGPADAIPTNTGSASAVRRSVWRDPYLFKFVARR